MEQHAQKNCLIAMNTFHDEYHKGLKMSTAIWSSTHRKTTSILLYEAAHKKHTAICTPICDCHKDLKLYLAINQLP